MMALSKEIASAIKTINKTDSQEDRLSGIGMLIENNSPYDLYQCKTKKQFSERHGNLADMLMAIDDKSAAMTKIANHTGIKFDSVQQMHDQLKSIQKDTKPGLLDQSARMLYGVVSHLPFTKPLQKLLLKGADVVWSKPGFGRVTQTNGGILPPKHPDFSSDNQRNRFDKVATQIQNGLLEAPDMSSPSSVFDGRHRSFVAQELDLPILGVQFGQKPNHQASRKM